MSFPVRAAAGVGAAALAATALALGPASGAHALPGTPSSSSTTQATGGADHAPKHVAAAKVGASRRYGSGLVSLNVTPRVQEKENWCWAATASAAADYLGASVSQNAFCDLATGRSRNAMCPDTQGDIDMIQNALGRLGLNPGYGSGSALSFSGVQREVQANRPTLARILWRAGGGHYLLVEGMDPSAHTVQWIDPWPNSRRVNVADYNQFRSNSDFTWTHTISQIGAN